MHCPDIVSVNDTVRAIKLDLIKYSDRTDIIARRDDVAAAIGTAWGQYDVAVLFFVRSCNSSICRGSSL